MADLEARTEVVGAVVQQQDGENAVVDDRADQFRGPIEKRFQVERGVKRVCHADQIIQVRGFHAGVYGVQVRMRIGGVGGTVIALELRLFRRRWGKGRHGGRIGMITQGTVPSFQASAACPNRLKIVAFRLDRGGAADRLSGAEAMRQQRAT